MRRTRRTRKGVRSKKSVRRYSKKRSRKSKRILLSKKRKQRGGGTKGRDVTPHQDTAQPAVWGATYNTLGRRFNEAQKLLTDCEYKLTAMEGDRQKALIKSML